MKEVRYRHRTEKASLTIKAPEAEMAEPLARKLLRDRGAWLIKSVSELDWIKILKGE